MEITFARECDIDSRMRLVHGVKESFPGLETDEALDGHRHTVLAFMRRESAICAKIGDRLVGASLFSREDNMLCFLAVDPEVRRRRIAEGMFALMLPQMHADRPITVTTHRDGVPEGAAARAFYQKLGFVPGKLTVEFDSPVQEFVMDAGSRQTSQSSAGR